MTAPQARLGYLLIIAATLFWGTSTVAGRMLMLRGVPPLVLAQLAMVVSWAVLCAYVAATGWRRLAVERRDIWRFALLGSLGFAGASTAMNIGIKLTNAPTTVVLHYLAPALVLVWSALRGKEPLSGLRAISVVLCIAGCALTAGLHQGQLAFNPIGVAAAIIAAFLFAFVTVFAASFTGRYDAIAFTSYTFLAAGITLAFVPGGLDWSIFREKPHLITGVALYSVFLAAAPPAFYFAGLRHVSSTAAMIICSFEVVVSAVASYAVLAEALGPSQMAGAALILAAIAVVELARRKDNKSLPALAPEWDAAAAAPSRNADNNPG